MAQGIGQTVIYQKCLNTSGGQSKISGTKYQKQKTLFSVGTPSHLESFLEVHDDDDDHYDDGDWYDIHEYDDLYGADDDNYKNTDKQ